MTANVLIVLAVLLFAPGAPVLAGEAFFGSVKKIIDGDSLLVVSGRKSIEVRLYGIDCPEYNQPFSSAAKNWVKKRVYGHQVLVKPEYSDSYKRVVAIVDYDDTTLNSELVKDGLAWVYPRFCRKEICTSWQEMEKSAQAAKRGLWSAKQPVPPWQWKRMKHGN